MRRALLFLPLALALAGCGAGKPKFVPVSGRITTADGKPLANVHVQFQPLAPEKDKDPGPGSYGVTDADGRYTLKIASQQYEGDGAVVGKHRVSIGTILPGEGKKATDPEVGSPDGATPEDLKAAKLERIPEKYNQNSTLTFDVPEGGSDKADFAIEVTRGTGK